MSESSKQPSHQGALRLLLIASVGATGLLLYWKSRDRVHKRADASYETPDTSFTRPRPGDILLFHNAKGMNRMITTFTGSPFYHAALYVSPGLAIEASLPGVQYRKLTGPGNSYVVVPAPKGHGREALAWAKTQLGDAYSHLDLVIIVLDKLFRSVHFTYTPPGQYSCGRFVEAAFAQAGMPLITDRDQNDIVPGDFERFIPAAERIGIR